MSELDKSRQIMGEFFDWSPAQLAYVLGVRINLRGHSCGLRSAYFERRGKATVMSHERACLVLARLAQRHNIDPASPPIKTPRALIDGQEQMRRMGSQNAQDQGLEK